MYWKKALLVLDDRCKAHKINTWACITLLPTENNTTNEEQHFLTASSSILRRRSTETESIFIQVSHR